jgi:hypothetical protein
MTYVYDGIKKKCHPEEAAQAAVSKDARRRSNTPENVFVGWDGAGAPLLAGELLRAPASRW